MTSRYRIPWIWAWVILCSLTTLASAQTRPTAKRVFAWVESMSGTEEHPLRWPIGVAAGAGSEFAVLDAHGPRLIVFRRTGVPWEVVHVADLPKTPSDVTYDRGRYVVSFRSTPALLAIDEKSWQQSQLQIPQGVIPGALASAPIGGILMHDLARNRVFLLDASGRELKKITLGETASSLIAKRSGGFLASIAEQSRILSFDANWKPDGEWNLPHNTPFTAWPTGMAANPGGEILVLDRHAARILVFSAAGQLIGIGSGYGYDSGLLYLPADSTRLMDGLLVIADEGNGRVQLFRRLDRSFAQ